MSAETSTWLNTNTLIGFTEKRGNAWHYRAEDQGTQSNHYTGAIPVQDVRDRLFHWKAVEGTVESTFFTAEGVTRVTDPERKTIVRPDTQEILGVFKTGYTIHDYDEWLINNIAALLDGDLSIGSAGLLKGGAIAWVQVEFPDTIETPEGVSFRPFLSGATSLDGSLSSTYQAGAQVIVCDNTLSAALGEVDALRIKVKHSSRSIGKIGDVRSALGIVHKVAEDFEAQVAALCSTEVTDKDWTHFLEAQFPVAEGVEGRSRTIAENKREVLTGLWKNDNRVTPWKNTAFGVLQAVNTWEHHLVNPKGETSRADRNALRTVTGKVDALDRSTLDTLNLVLASA